MNVALIGYRGCGKSTIGHKLADRLWQTFIDLDDLIVRKAGKTIKQIFEQDGEPHYRDIETQCLHEAIQIPDHVLSLGGGSLDREQNREMLKSVGGKIIYLKCDPQTLLTRIEADPRSAETRPNLTTLGGGIDEIKLKLAQREPVYRQVMTSELDVTNLNPDDALVYIARML
jgi:shikimate kinase